MSRPTHAGGVVYRREGDEVQVLLVRASDVPSEWVLPKGHVEAGESWADAAKREVREEAGVVARLEDKIGVESFESPQGHVKVVYYLMRYESEAESDELRERTWVPFSEAREMVRFEDARRVLDSARRALDGRPYT